MGCGASSEAAATTSAERRDSSDAAAVAPPSKKPVIFCIGGPASGKGALTGSISSEYQFQEISTGDVLRAEVARGTDLGKRIDEILQKAQLVPPEIAVSLIKQEVQTCTARGILLDGFPRSREQRDAWWAELGPPTAVINLDCPESVMEARALNRAKLAAEQGLPVRKDDNIEVIRKRFHTHQEQAVPVAEEMMTQMGPSRFVTIDASKDKESVKAAAEVFLATLGIVPVQTVATI